MARRPCRWVDHQRSVIDDGGGRETLFQRSGIDEWFETGAGLAPGLGDVVELRPIEIETPTRA